MNIDDEVTAVETLLHISLGGYEGSTTNIDVNHSGAKRQKIPSNMDTEETKENNFVSSLKIFQTSTNCKTCRA